MPRTVSFPAPSATRCPICAADLDRPACPRCGASFTTEDGGTLWRVDHDLFDLCRIRNDVVRRLLADADARASAPVAPSTPRGSWAAPTTAPDPLDALVSPTAPAGPAPAATAPPSAPPRRPRRALSVAEVLVGLGALSLVAAVIVFAAVTWSDLAASAQGGLVVGATGLVVGLMAACRRRDLVATAESLGVVAVALALADVHVVRVGLDVVTRPAWAVGVAVVAGTGVALGRRLRVRTPALAGCALAFVPAPLLLAGWGPGAVAAGLAGEALVAAAVALRSDGTAAVGTERAVVVAGAVVSWAASVLVAGGAAVDQLAAVPTQAPFGSAAVFAGLAGGSLVLARRRAAAAVAPGPVAVLSGPGALLAFLPVPLVAVATGSASLVVAVVVAHALVGLALRVTGRLTPAEAPAVAGATVASWVAGAGGALLVGLVDLVGNGGRVPWSAAVLLTALAVGSLVLARRSPAGDDADPLVGAAAEAGAVLLAVPAVLLALAGGAATVVAVLAAEGMVAVTLALLAGPRRLRAVELAVARVGGPVATTLGVAGAVVLGLAAVGADGLGDRVVPVVVLAVVAAALVAVGREARRDGVVAVGAAVAFAPVPLAVAGFGSPAVLAWSLLGLAVAAAVANAETGVVRTVVRVGGSAAWSAAGVTAGAMGVAGWLATPTAGPAGAVAVLGAMAIVAGAVALRPGVDGDVVGIALGAAVLPLLGAAGLAAGGVGADGRVTAVLAAAAGLGGVAARLRRVDADRPWLAPQVVALAAGAVLGVAPLVRTLEVLALLVDRASAAPDVGADRVVADWLRPALGRPDVAALPGWATLGQLAALAVLAVVLAGAHRRARGVAATAVGVAALVVVPVVAGLTVVEAVAGLALVVVAGAEALRRRPRSPEALAGTAAVAALGLGLAVASAPLAVGWTVLVGGLVVGLAGLRVHAGAAEAPVWAFVAGVVTVGAVVLDARLLEAGPDRSGIAVALAAAAVAGGAWAASGRGRPGREAASALDAVVVGAALVAAATVRSLDALSVVVAVAAVAAAVTAARPGRRPVALLAAGLGVVLAWLQLGGADVALVEAYTLPVALWALAVGLVAGRGGGSWAQLGAGLVVAVGPTAFLALVDPTPLRTVVVVAAGAGLAVAGAVGRLQAPLAVGGVALTAMALRTLGPVAAELPRSVALAVAGLVLLAVGATFEQRRQDLRHARSTFTRLG